MHQGEIKIFVMDVDGTLTDGKIYIGTKGESLKAFNVKDGFGIHNMLIPRGIVPIIITGRRSKIVVRRCHELGIKEVHQGVHNKESKISEISQRLNVPMSSIAFIGDDMNDFDIMMKVKTGGGVVGCPIDASKEIQSIANYVCEQKGGEGAVREFIGWLLFPKK
ncbi:MAG: HAD hydrolase family protein [Candidatus Izemoplasmatales bacterium]